MHCNTCSFDFVLNKANLRAKLICSISIKLVLPRSYICLVHWIPLLRCICLFVWSICRFLRCISRKEKSLKHVKKEPLFQSCSKKLRYRLFNTAVLVSVSFHEYQDRKACWYLIFNYWWQNELSTFEMLDFE